uniref:Uncharacterized protein n=1 Tax=Alexandrium monilatum TaxID=311494 RepID=A0A7S4Q6G5_9DINO
MIPCWERPITREELASTGNLLEGPPNAPAAATAAPSRRQAAGCAPTVVSHTAATQRARVRAEPPPAARTASPAPPVVAHPGRVTRTWAPPAAYAPQSVGVAAPAPPPPIRQGVLQPAALTPSAARASPFIAPSAAAAGPPRAPAALATGAFAAAPALETGQAAMFLEPPPPLPMPSLGKPPPVEDASLSGFAVPGWANTLSTDVSTIDGSLRSTTSHSLVGGWQNFSLPP